MSKWIAKIFKSTITLGIIYLALGISMILFPIQAVNVVCKIIFGIVLICAGAYHIMLFVFEKKETTIFDLFSGVIVFVLGIFLFYNPQIVVKLLQYMLGAFVLVDSLWTLVGTIKLAKKRRWEWKLLLLGSIIFIGLGVAIIIYPFETLEQNIIFAGAVFIANGLEDILLFILLKMGMKKAEVLVENSEEKPEASKKRWKKRKEKDLPTEDRIEEVESTQEVSEPEELLENEKKEELKEWVD